MRSASAPAAAISERWPSWTIHLQEFPRWQRQRGGARFRPRRAASPVTRTRETMYHRPQLFRTTASMATATSTPRPTSSAKGSHFQFHRLRLRPSAIGRSSGDPGAGTGNWLEHRLHDGAQLSSGAFGDVTIDAGATVSLLGGAYDFGVAQRSASGAQSRLPRSMRDAHRGPPARPSKGRRSGFIPSFCRPPTWKLIVLGNNANPSDPLEIPLAADLGEYSIESRAASTHLTARCSVGSTPAVTLRQAGRLQRQGGRLRSGPRRQRTDPGPDCQRLLHQAPRPELRHAVRQRPESVAGVQ